MQARWVRSETWLTDFLSFKWMMRALGLIELFMLAIANLVSISMSSSVGIGSVVLPLVSPPKARAS